jgi:hypothetical protein
MWLDGRREVGGQPCTATQQSAARAGQTRQALAYEFPFSFPPSQLSPFISLASLRREKAHLTVADDLCHTKHPSGFYSFQVGGTTTTSVFQGMFSLLSSPRCSCFGLLQKTPRGPRCIALPFQPNASLVISSGFPRTSLPSHLVAVLTHPLPSTNTPCHPLTHATPSHEHTFVSNTRINRVSDLDHPLAAPSTQRKGELQERYYLTSMNQESVLEI